MMYARVNPRRRVFQHFTVRLQLSCRGARPRRHDVNVLGGVFSVRDFLVWLVIFF